MSMRFTLPLMLILATAAHAAEEPGTLSKEATAAGPAVDTSAPKPAASDTKPAGPQAVVRNDRLDLDTTVVTGNRELPKVLYIVPWKKSDLGELPAQPFNTLLDEALAPVDRDVFRREVTYYAEMNGGADAAPAQPQRSEK
ncbi:MAG TPA: hypothetical protein VGD45_08880 [Steroidobacter sp.]|uniref:hypothetical protein n=1 Tax=Steroidobacter sp. TaxID=1978227 RepID=UPI002EDA9CFA